MYGHSIKNVRKWSTEHQQFFQTVEKVHMVNVRSLHIRWFLAALHMGMESDANVWVALLFYLEHDYFIL